jgi:uncharacterized protein YlaI
MYYKNKMSRNRRSIKYMYCEECDDRPLIDEKSMNRHKENHLKQAKTKSSFENVLVGQEVVTNQNDS